MYKINDKVELPITEEELSYTEVGEGIGTMLCAFYETIKDNQEQRQYFAIVLGNWLIDYWKMIHRAGLLKVYVGEPGLNGFIEYSFAIGAETEVAINLTFPCTDEDPAVIKLTNDLIAISEIVGVEKLSV